MRSIAFILLTLLAAPTAHTADALQSLSLGTVRVAGEIGQRIDATIHNNLLVVDADNDFLKPFAEKSAGSGYIGLGKFMLSAIDFAVYSGDPRVIALKNHLVTRLIETQEEDGYAGFFIPSQRMHTLWDVHEIGYLIAALLADYQHFGNQASLDAAVKAADYILAHWDEIPKDWVQQTSVATHVAVTGIERTLLALHRETDDPRYLSFVLHQRGLADWDFPIVIGRRPGLEGHIYAYMARSLAQLELFRLSPEPRLLKSSDRAFDFLTHHDGAAISGGAGQWEIWTDDQDGRGQLAETCATAYQIRVYDSLLRLRGEARYAGLIERTAFNSLFAAQSLDGRRIRYYAPTTGQREYYRDDTYCCPGNYRRIIAELPSMIYYRQGGGIAISLYTASQATLDLAGGAMLGIRQVTDYPTSGTVTVHIDPSRPARFPVTLRIPSWAAGTTVSVNGRASRVAATPGSFLTFDREWKAGDRIRLEMPMEFRFIRGRQRQAGRAAVMRGPKVFCLDPSQAGSLATQDAADLERYTLDPGSAALVSDTSVRPDGVACRVGAWKPGYPTAPEHDLQLTLTEFPDPGCRATFFRLRDMAPAVDDELLRPVPDA